VTGLPPPPRVVNVGLALFADTLARAGAAVVHTDWRPPAGGDRRLAELLARLGDAGDERPANREWLRRVQAGGATLIGVRPAREAIPALARDRVLLHAGPPIAWERMCGPVRGAVVGACLFEGWARTPDEAWRLAESGAQVLAARG